MQQRQNVKAKRRRNLLCRIAIVGVPRANLGEDGGLAGIVESEKEEPQFALFQLVLTNDAEQTHVLKEPPLPDEDMGGYIGMGTTGHSARNKLCRGRRISLAKLSEFRDQKQKKARRECKVTNHFNAD